MQFVEIAREVDKSALKVIVFDEPTAVLTESEAETLLGVMRSLAGEGVAILFITHRLDEVMQAAADRARAHHKGSRVGAATKRKSHTGRYLPASMWPSQTPSLAMSKAAAR